MEFRRLAIELGRLAEPPERVYVDKEGQNSAVHTASSRNGAAESGTDSPSFERHYAPEELAILWGLSPDKVRRMFQREPGVLVIENSSPMYSKRRYRTLRIPESVAERVHRRLSVAIR